MPIPTLQSDPPPRRVGGVETIVLGGHTLEGGDRLDGYVYVRPIANGGMAHVLMARDTNGKVIALKVLKSSRIETGLPRFRREFHALRRIKHPNVIEVHGWGVIRGHPYIAMEYVEGTDLHKVVRGFKDLDFEERWRRTESCLLDICKALSHIHRRGLVHRDLKPSNIMVEPSGRCKLTDFGIVKDLDPASDPFVSTTLVGTWAYASPEQISGQPIDHRSDIYSLGVILYAMLTGRRPFAAKDMAGYLGLHRDQPPTAPSVFVPEVPALLEEICLKMLEKAPRDRFQSAIEVLERLTHDAVLTVEPSSEEVAWEPPLVGRDAELEQVRDAISALTRREGGVVLIEGAEGGGRSRLLRAALAHAAVIGIPVHTASLNAPRSSFEALIQLAEDIGRELGARVPPDLARALSAFARGRGRVAGDLRYQLYDGIRDTLGTLLEDGPRIIAIDDLHHGQLPVLALVGYLVRTLVVRDGAPLLVVATARNDLEVPVLDSFRDGSELGLIPKRVALGPLTQEDVERIVVATFGRGRRALSAAARLFGETQGNPFYVTEFLRNILQQGGLEGADAPEEEEIDATEVVHRPMRLPPGIRQVVDDRLGRLGPEERRIVEVIAAAGREVDLDMVLDVLEIGDGEDGHALDRIEGLVRQGLLVERRTALQVLIDFAHGKIGELIYADLAESRRAELHLHIAEALEERESDNPVVSEAIGEHFRLAGRQARGWRYLVLGAQRLWERGMLSEAGSLADRATAIQDVAEKGLAAEDFARIQLDLLRVRADVHYNQGDWPLARLLLTELRAAALQVEDRPAAARAALDLGTTLWSLGEEEPGRALVLEVLETARGRHDRATIMEALRRLATFAWEEGNLDECEALASQGLIGATSPGLAEGRAELLLVRTAVQGSRGHLAAATAGMAEAEEILKRLRNKRTRATVLGNLAEMLTWQGEMAPALERAIEARGLARDVLYRVGVAFAERGRAMALLDIGDLDQAAEALQESLSISQELGIDEDVAVTHYLFARLCLRRGNPGKAVRHALAGMEAAASRDPEGYALPIRATLATALARMGDSRQASQILTELEAELDALLLPRRVRLQLLLADGWAAAGDPRRAASLARLVVPVARARGFRTWALGALVILARIEEGDAAEAARREAAILARTLLGGLPTELADHFRRRPDIADLWLLPSDPSTTS